MRSARQHKSTERILPSFGISPLELQGCFSQHDVAFFVHLVYHQQCQVLLALLKCIVVFVTGIYYVCTMTEISICKPYASLIEVSGTLVIRC